MFAFCDKKRFWWMTLKKRAVLKKRRFVFRVNKNCNWLLWAFCNSFGNSFLPNFLYLFQKVWNKREKVTWSTWVSFLLMEPRCSLAQKKSVNPFWDKLRHQLLRSRFYRNTIEIVASKKKKVLRSVKVCITLKPANTFFVL